MATCDICESITYNLYQHKNSRACVAAKNRLDAARKGLIRANRTYVALAKKHNIGAVCIADTVIKGFQHQRGGLQSHLYIPVYVIIADDINRCKYDEDYKIALFVGYVLANSTFNTSVIETIKKYLAAQGKTICQK